MKIRSKLWKLAAQTIETGEPAVVVAVVDHRGSVPGKTGAMMVVTRNRLEGTIGGGLVEHQLIELSRNRPEIHLHSFAHDGKSSDSICSGRQTMAVVPLSKEHLSQVMALSEIESNGGRGTLVLSPQGPVLEPPSQEPILFSGGENDWRFHMPIGPLDTLTIIGGGHVGLALSRVMATLPFRIVVVDDRANLPSLSQNLWAHAIHQTEWSDVAETVVEGHRSWVVIMTRGHRHDLQVLKSLARLDLRYLGMMGSKVKVAEIFAAMKGEGFSAETLEKVHAPIGMPIASHTPEEIAISIAAEIIQVRNRG